MNAVKQLHMKKRVIHKIDISSSVENEKIERKKKK